MFSALKKGNSLENPVFWKKAQLYLTIIGVMLPLAAVLFPSLQVIIDKDILAKTLVQIAAVNAYLTVATTDKIGV